MIEKDKMIEHLNIIIDDIKWQSTFINSDFEWDHFLDTVQQGKELFDKIKRFDMDGKI